VPSDGVSAQNSSVTPLESLAQAITGARDLAAVHRRGLTATSVALLAGCAAAAFAIAPLAPDASTLPQRVLVEASQPEAIAPQLEALAAHEFDLNRSDTIRPGDTAGTLLERLGVADASAVAFLRGDPSTRRLFEGRSGRLVQVRAGEDGRLKSLVARSPAPRAEQVASHFTRLSVTRDARGEWQAIDETLPLQSQARLASGTIRSSLFAASEEARIPDAVAIQMAEIFAADIDMHRELRRGDTFSVVYEELSADGEPWPWTQGAGRVLAAEFVNAGKTHHAVWYRDDGGRGNYFDLSGLSKKRAFLASPLEFSRVTSGFAMRFHPIQQTWRRHLGVDYAAPIGTPVRTIADGTVDFAGWQNGYGNVVSVRHGNERTTLYAHMSRIDVKKGQRVEQGQHVGAVGSTGWSTGPHLHLEFRVNGVHQDPLRVAKASEAIALAPASKAEFGVVAQTMQTQLDVAETLLGARGRGE
jgi:murein DD-endopeptidase MepM/ murein hydrolase activator NlpD